MKYIGITALCLSLSFAGLYVLYYHGRRIFVLKKLSEFFAEFACVSSLFQLEVVQCIKRLSDSERFSSLTFAKEIIKVYEDGDDIRSIWTDCIRNSREFMYLDKYQKEQLMFFSEVFGKSGIEDFSRKCTEYSMIFANAAQKEDLLKEKNAALYGGIGIFAAAAVFIILI